MLTREQAEEELKKLEKKEWTVARMAATDTLPEGLRETARSILGANEATPPALRRAKAKSPDLVKAFKEMDEKGRLQFFETMAPGLGVLIERGWQLMARLPYQSGYARKPFRSAHPESYIGRRINWVLQLLDIVGPYQQNVAWFAAWAPFLAQYMTADNLGLLFAAAIDAGGPEGEEVFQILCASGRNEHPIGGMGRHVIRALLSAQRPDGWEFVEKMLLAAQREEGLRQTILETADESHPQAFRRMLKLILDQNLTRFSATVRAFDTWLGYQWDGASGSAVTKTVEKMLLYLEDKAAREAALKDKDAEQAYLALWAWAFDDAVGVVAPAAEMLKHSSAEHRFVATHLLDQLGLLSSQKHLLTPLEDADLRVATRALLAFQRTAGPRVIKADLFERLEKLLPRFPDKPEKLKAIVWPWTEYTISREAVANVLPKCLGERPPSRLIPHLNEMGTYQRAAVIGTLAGQGKWDPPVRDTLFALVGDASRHVRETALRHLGQCEVKRSEAEGIEKLLERKTGDLRRGALTLLARQHSLDALASADRLLAAKSQPQRLAGLELLRLLHEKKRCEAEVRSRAEAYAQAHPKANDAEQQHLNAVLEVKSEVAKLDDALGLAPYDSRSWPAQPVARPVVFHSLAVMRIVNALEQIYKDNAQQIVSFKTYRGCSESKNATP